MFQRLLDFLIKTINCLFILLIFIVAVPNTYATTYVTNPCETTSTYTGGGYVSSSSNCTVEQAATIVTTDTVLRVSSVRTANQIGNRISNAISGTAKGFNVTGNGFSFGNSSGLSSGNSFQNIGIWGSYLYNDYEDDFASTAFDGNTHSVLTGIDYSASENLIIGLAFSYEDTDIDTTFNAGKIESDGYTIAPYLGYLLTSTLSIDLSGGYSDIEIDQFRTDPTTGNRVTSSLESDRYFAAANLNGYLGYSNWTITPKVGVLYARDEQDAFTETNVISGATNAVASRTNELGQFRGGIDFTYNYHNSVQPYAGFLYAYDFSRDDIQANAGQAQPENDEDEVNLKFGVRYFGSQNLSGSLDILTTQGREDFDNYSVGISGRYDF